MKTKKLVLKKIQVTRLDNLTQIKGGSDYNTSQLPPEATTSLKCEEIITETGSIISLLTEPVNTGTSI